MSERTYTPLVDLDVLVSSMQTMSPKDARTTLEASLSHAFHKGRLVGMDHADELHAQYPVPSWFARLVSR